MVKSTGKKNKRNLKGKEKETNQMKQSEAQKKIKALVKQFGFEKIEDAKNKSPELKQVIMAFFEYVLDNLEKDDLDDTMMDSLLTDIETALTKFNIQQTQQLQQDLPHSAEEAAKLVQEATITTTPASTSAATTSTPLVDEDELDDSYHQEHINQLEEQRIQLEQETKHFEKQAKQLRKHQKEENKVSKAIEIVSWWIQQQQNTPKEACKEEGRVWVKSYCRKRATDKDGNPIMPPKPKSKPKAKVS